jgi:uncharacterized protein YggE
MLGTFSTLAAQTTDHTLTVIGSGSAHAAADKVTLQLTVTSQDQTATALFVKQTDVLQRLRKSLEAAGVKSRDVVELPFRLMPNYEYGQNGQRIISYRVDTPLELQVEDMKSLPRIIDLAAQGGASAVNVGAFSQSGGKSLHTEAVRNALADARKEGELLAKEMGKSLGDVISVAVMEQEAKPAAGSGGEEEEEEARERAQSAKNASQPATLSEKAELRVVYQLR